MNTPLRHLIALLAVCTIAMLTSARELRCQQQNGVWRNYTTTSQPTCIVDQGRHLWIGTHFGLVRMTKATGEMHVFNKANSGLIDNVITGLAADSAGNIWATVGINDFTGLVKYDGTTWTSQRITWCQALTVAAGRNGDVWVGTNALARLMRQRGTNLQTVYETNGGISRVAVDRNDVPWCLLPDGKLGKWTGSTFETHTPAEYELTSIYTVFFDRGNRMWLGGSDKVVCVDGAQKTIFTADMTGNIGGGASAITQDPAGNIWIVKRRDAAKYDGTTWTAYNDMMPISINRTAIGVTASSDGTIWCAAYDGLAKWSNGTWTWLSCNALGVPTTVGRSILVDRAGVRWFGTDNGLVRFDGNEWRAFTRENSLLSGSNVRCLALDRTSGIWLGTSSGIARFDGVEWFFPPRAADETVHAIVSGIVESMVVDRAGNCWAGFGGLDSRGKAVGRFDGTSWTLFTPDNSPLPAAGANAMAMDSSGNIWVGIYNDGIARYDGTNWTVIKTTSEGLPLKGITSIMCDRAGVLYITSYSFGVLEFDGTVWTHYNTETFPMVANDVCTMTVDRRNRKWLGYSGIMGNDRGVQKMGQGWPSYTRENSGLAEGNVYAVAVDSSDNVWVMSRGGLSVLMAESGTTDAPLLPATSSGIAARCLPHPVKGEAVIEYYVPGTVSAQVELVLFDALGNPVLPLVREHRSPGDHRVRFDAHGLAAGTYFGRLRIGTEFMTLPVNVVGQ